MIVDCQGLANVMAGHALLTEPACRPLFVRLARRLAILIRAGWLPRADVGSYIEWRPRRFNVVADYLCNAAMDQQQSSQFVDEQQLSRAVSSQSHLQLFSDGGLRPGDCAATGWILYSVSRCSEEWLWAVLAWKTQFLEDACIKSSFQVESMALDDAGQFLSRVLT